MKTLIYKPTQNRKTQEIINKNKKFLETFDKQNKLM